MIRDEFKNADKKVIDKKANKKMQQMGERAFYAKKLSLYNDLIKPVKTSTIFCSVCFAIPTVLYLLELIITKKLSTNALIMFIITACMIAWCVVWFAFLAPRIRKKIAFYKSELARLNREYVMKVK